MTLGNISRGTLVGLSARTFPQPPIMGLRRTQTIQACSMDTRVPRTCCIRCQRSFTASSGRIATGASAGRTTPQSGPSVVSPSHARTGSAGFDRGGHRAAAMYTLIGTCRLNDIDPRAWFAYGLEKLPEHPSARMDELMPWNWPSQSAIAVSHSKGRLIGSPRPASPRPSPNACVVKAWPAAAAMPAARLSQKRGRPLRSSRSGVQDMPIPGAPIPSWHSRRLTGASRLEIAQRTKQSRCRVRQWLNGLIILLNGCNPDSRMVQQDQKWTSRYPDECLLIVPKLRSDGFTAY